MTPTLASLPAEVKIVVPQRYKDFVARRQYQRLWYSLAVALGGVNGILYLFHLFLHWKWNFYFPGDVLLLVIGVFAYAKEVRKPWYYELNERRIKLFVVTPKSHLGELKELEWAKTQIVGVEQDEWQGLPCLRLKVLPDAGRIYMMVYSHAEKEDVETKVLPLIEKYRRQYRQKLWADLLRT